MIAKMYEKRMVGERVVRVTPVNHDGIGPSIPGTGLNLHPNTTLNELFYAAGYVTFDTALPQGWVDEWNKCRYGPYTVPKGVWCYDRDKGCGLFGKFVSMDEALIELGKKMNEQERMAV